MIESDDFPDLTTSTIRMQLYNNGNKVFDISGGNGITVNSATSFTIDEVSKVNNNFPSGESIGDLEITDTNGYRKTYFRAVYTVQKQYTI